MSREIKFRAWDEKHKQFADYEDIEECLSCQNRDGWKSSDGMGCCFGIYAVEILADCIIEQYTGLEDKNGKEIYEGDIVKYLKANYEVYFDKMQGWRGLRRGSHSTIPIGETVYEMTINCVDRPEVIGNIHENPELLEDENE